MFGGGGGEDVEQVSTESTFSHICDNSTSLSTLAVIYAVEGGGFTSIKVNQASFFSFLVH